MHLVLNKKKKRREGGNNLHFTLGRRREGEERHLYLYRRCQNNSLTFPRCPFIINHEKHSEKVQITLRRRGRREPRLNWAREKGRPTDHIRFPIFFSFSFFFSQFSDWPSSSSILHPPPSSIPYCTVLFKFISLLETVAAAVVCTSRSSRDKVSLSLSLLSPLSSL